MGSGMMGEGAAPHGFLDNCTDLIVASYLGHDVVVQLLLERGDNVNECATG